MTNRNRGQNVQGSDDEDSQPQSKTADSVASQNLENVEVEESTDEMYNDGMTVNNDSHEEIISRCEGTSESMRSIADHHRSSFITKGISKEPPKKMKKLDATIIIQQSIELREQRATERAIERTKLEDSKSPNDPLWHFFLSMYQTNQKMPPACQHFVRSKIFQVVSETEASLLNTQPPFQEPVHPTHSYDLTDISNNNSFPSESASSSLTPRNESTDASSGENRLNMINMVKNFSG